LYFYTSEFVQNRRVLSVEQVEDYLCPGRKNSGLLSDLYMLSWVHTREERANGSKKNHCLVLIHRNHRRIHNIIARFRRDNSWFADHRKLGV